MSRYSPFRAAVLAASVSLAIAASSAAQTRPAYDDEYDGWQRIAQDTGYSAGLERGEADARARRAFNFTRDSDYLRADIGYRRDLTSLDRYRRVFRQGFAAGYQEGYHGDADVREMRDVRQSSGIARDVRRTASADIAFEYGVADGYKAGVAAIRDNDKFEPTDHGAYRDGDRGYEGRYGERDVYKTEYRDGFRAGYTRGYREGRP